MDRVYEFFGRPITLGGFKLPEHKPLEARPVGFEVACEMTLTEGGKAQLEAYLQGIDNIAKLTYNDFVSEQTVRALERFIIVDVGEFEFVDLEKVDGRFVASYKQITQSA